MKRLTDSERDVALSTVPDWTYSADRGGCITRTFRFEGFAQAFAFMTQAALYAEKHDHHPEWFNVYDRLEVTLTTHDANGLSQRDIALAQFMDDIYRRHTGRTEH